MTPRDRHAMVCPECDIPGETMDDLFEHALVFHPGNYHDLTAMAGVVEAWASMSAEGVTNLIRIRLAGATGDPDDPEYAWFDMAFPVEMAEWMLKRLGESVAAAKTGSGTE